MIDLHALQGDNCVHVLTIHRGKHDDTPVQLVSADQVKEWMRKEVDYDALLARLEDTSEDMAPLPHSKTP